MNRALGLLVSGLLWMCAPSSALLGDEPVKWTAKWIAAEPDRPTDPPTADVDHPQASSKAMPVFRHEFQLPRQVRKASLSISGLGQYEVHVNGRNVTDAVLTPGWTDYREHILFNSYDVTSLLQTNANGIGVLLGNGMYNVENIRGRYTKFVGSFGQPKLILQMHIVYADGTSTDVVSDGSWKVAPGPITFSSTFGGEDYDAALEHSGWDKSNFNDKVWASAVIVQSPGGQLVRDSTPPIRVARVLQTVKVAHPRPDISIYDLGTNFAGWPSIIVTGSRGASVKLVCGELLDSNGRVTQRSANAFPTSENSFTYVLKGVGLEKWHPRFSYYGFRYVEVRSSGGVNIERVEGQVIHADVAQSGTFTSSNELFNRIHQLIDNAILSNTVSVLTDCPHREKLGWLEQTHLAGSSIMYNYDVSKLYAKIGGDMQDSQLPSGLVPAIAPEYVPFVDQQGNNTSFRDSPEWGSAAILSPWTAYQFYGDLEPLRQHYDSMIRYAAYLKSRANDHMISYGLGDWYDIGPKEPGESQLTGKGLTATAIYFQDLEALSQIAALLDKPAEATQFATEAEEVKRSFNAHLFHPETHQYDRGSQTANAMPLVLGLVPAQERKAVLENLVADIRKHENHVTAGDIGFHYVVRALTDHGRSDVLFDMLTRTDTPSYGDQLRRGATTLTEAWDTNPNSSQNHFMLGHAEEWFYRGLGGIDFDMARAQQERIRIQPSPVGDIQSTSASFHSALGLIISKWSRQENTLRIDVTIPSPGIVVFPASYSGTITESGKPLTGRRNIRARGSANGGREYVVGAGEYHFALTK